MEEWSVLAYRSVGRGKEFLRSRKSWHFLLPQENPSALKTRSLIHDRNDWVKQVLSTVQLYDQN